MTMIRILTATLIWLALSLPSEAAARFWFGGTGNYSDTAHWGTASNGVGAPASVPGASDAVTLDANSGGGTLTFDQDVTIQSLTTSASVTSISVGAHNVTLTAVGGFLCSGTGTHTIDMGTQTWTVSAATTGATIWNISNANLTLTANTSTLVFSSNQTTTGGSIRFGGKTYSTVNITGTGRWYFGATGGTFGTLSLAAGQHIILTSNVTYTISTGSAWAGTRAAPIIIGSDSPSVTAGAILVVSAGTLSLDWGLVSNVTVSSGTANLTNAITYGAVTGWTLQSGPSAGGGGIIGG